MTKSFSQKGCVIAGNPARVIGNVNKIRDSKIDSAFNFKGMNSEQKKKEILLHPEKYLKR